MKRKDVPFAAQKERVGLPLGEELEEVCEGVAVLLGCAVVVVDVIIIQGKRETDSYRGFNEEHVAQAIPAIRPERQAPIYIDAERT